MVYSVKIIYSCQLFPFSQLNFRADSTDCILFGIRYFLSVSDDGIVHLGKHDVWEACIKQLLVQYVVFQVLKWNERIVNSSFWQTSIKIQGIYRPSIHIKVLKCSSFSTSVQNYHHKIHKTKHITQTYMSRVSKKMKYTEKCPSSRRLNLILLCKKPFVYFGGKVCVYKQTSCAYCKCFYFYHSCFETSKGVLDKKLILCK